MKDDLPLSTTSCSHGKMEALLMSEEHGKKSPEFTQGNRPFAKWRR